MAHPSGPPQWQFTLVGLLSGGPPYRVSSVAAHPSRPPQWWVLECPHWGGPVLGPAGVEVSDTQMAMDKARWTVLR